MQQFKMAIIDKGFFISDHFFNEYKIKKAEDSLNELGVFDFDTNEVTNTNLLHSSVPVFDLANDIRLKKLIDKISNREMYPVKAFVLDKTVANNWEIPWHQDLKIAVQERIPLKGYKNWSKESGIMHVEPPVEVMSQLLTLRIHFDSCNEENGATTTTTRRSTRKSAYAKLCPRITFSSATHWFTTRSLRSALINW